MKSKTNVEFILMNTVLRNAPFVVSAALLKTLSFYAGSAAATRHAMPSGQKRTRCSSCSGRSTTVESATTQNIRGSARLSPRVSRPSFIWVSWVC